MDRQGIQRLRLQQPRLRHRTGPQERLELLLQELLELLLQELLEMLLLAS
jgi:hypothetical protein